MSMPPCRRGRTRLRKANFNGTGLWQWLQGKHMGPLLSPGFVRVA